MILQYDLNNQCRWSNNVAIAFSIGPYEIMHFAYNNIKAKYDLECLELEEAVEIY